MKKIILLIVLLLLVACQTKPVVVETEVETLVETEVETTVETPEETPLETSVETVVETTKLTSVFTGLEVSESQKDARPIMVMIDNNPGARPQANLSKASLVYEMRVEGSYTRYIALFERTGENTLIGPIRSARPNFVSLALQHDAIFTHHGGSTDGNAMIAQYKMDDIDGMVLEGRVTFRYFDTNKKAPHNSYSKLEDIYKYQEARHRNLIRKSPGFLFHSTTIPLEGEMTNSVQLNYGSGAVKTEYQYDPLDQKYQKLRNGVLMVDELSKDPVKADNVIIQIARSYIYNGTHRAFETTGQGKAYYLNQGHRIELIWKKSDNHRELTQWYTMDGQELRLNPGQTWINVIDSTDLVFFNYK